MIYLWKIKKICNIFHLYPPRKYKNAWKWKLAKGGYYFSCDHGRPEIPTPRHKVSILQKYYKAEKLYKMLRKTTKRFYDRVPRTINTDYTYYNEYMKYNLYSVLERLLNAQIMILPSRNYIEITRFLPGLPYEYNRLRHKIKRTRKIKTHNDRKGSSPN